MQDLSCKINMTDSSRNKKTRYRMYFAWNYDKEIEDLNKLSREGWQLTKGGCFYSEFEKNTDEVYRYQIDFNNTRDDKNRYIETFEEQGWEYINSTFNGWHYFKKKYDENLTNEDYQIYVDKGEMLDRWIRLASVLIVALIVVIAFDVYDYIDDSQSGLAAENSLHRCIINTAINLSIIGVLGTGVANMRRIIDNKDKISKGISIFFVAVFLICVIYSLMI